MDRSADYLELARQLRQSPGNVDRAQMYASLASAEKLETFLDLTESRLSEIRPALDHVAADNEEQIRLLRSDITGLGNWLGDVIQEIRDLLASLLERAAADMAESSDQSPPAPPAPEPSAPAAPPPPPPPRPGSDANRLPQDFVNRFGYLERSVAAVSERASAVEVTTSELMERLGVVETAVIRVDERTLTIDAGLRDLSTRTARIEGQLDDLAEGLIEVEDRMARRLADAVAEIARLIQR